MVKNCCSQTIVLSVVGMALAGFLWISPACADENQLEAYDANGDGNITFGEVMRYLEPSIRSSFDTMDRNKDGVLSDKDFDDVRQGMKKWEDWLNNLLGPFLGPEESENSEVQRF